MKIEQITIKNFKTFKDVKIGNVPNFCVLIGANGSGKTTFLEVFGFLKEAMASDVNTALEKVGRGRGFDEVVSRGTKGPIEIKIQYRVKGLKSLVTYSLSINKDKKTDLAVVSREFLSYKRNQGEHRGVRGGRAFNFLDFSRGKGDAVPGKYEEYDSDKHMEKVDHKLPSPSTLAIRGLSQFQTFLVVVDLGRLIEGWHVSDIQISKARQGQNEATTHRHLSVHGDNLPFVVDHLATHHKKAMQKIVAGMKRIPGVSSVESKRVEETGQMILRIETKAFKDKPFLVQYVSDGTIKMLAYLVLLNDPDPYPLLCIEEPENQLYPELLARLVGEFKVYADEKKQRQVFITTHSPELLDEVDLHEVLVLKKGENGYTDIKPASSYPQVVKYMEDEGSKMGRLWMRGFLSED